MLGEGNVETVQLTSLPCFRSHFTLYVQHWDCSTHLTFSEKRRKKLTKKLKSCFWIQSELGNASMAFINVVLLTFSILIEGVLKHVSLHV